jgi:hypothetical protein
VSGCLLQEAVARQHSTYLGSRFLWHPEPRDLSHAAHMWGDTTKACRGPVEPLPLGPSAVHSLGVSSGGSKLCGNQAQARLAPWNEQDEAQNTCVCFPCAYALA